MCDLSEHAGSRRRPPGLLSDSASTRGRGAAYGSAFASSWGPRYPPERSALVNEAVAGNADRDTSTQPPPSIERVGVRGLKHVAADDPSCVTLREGCPRGFWALLLTTLLCAFSRTDRRSTYWRAELVEETADHGGSRYTGEGAPASLDDFGGCVTETARRKCLRSTRRSLPAAPSAACGR